MQIYYFSRTGRSKKIAEELATRYNTAVRNIDDHRNWSGIINYIKAGASALNKKAILADYIKPDLNDGIVVVFPLWAGTMPPGVRTFVNEVGRENIIAVVTSLGSTMNDRDGFIKVIDLAGANLELPNNIE